jgi:hypothetical protein
MILRLIVAAMLLGILASACSSSDDEASSDGADAAAQPESAPLDAQANSFSLGEPFRIDASVLPPPIGEQPLQGNVVLRFVSMASGLVLEEETVPSVATGYGGGYRDSFNAAGVYVAVFYTVTNETDNALIPGTHVNGAFSMVDEAGTWLPADIGSHGFDASAAFAIQADEEDPRGWVEVGETMTTAIAFDVSAGAASIRLVSELLGVELPLSIGE